jgi:uncharacterized protein involved in exopolysaccharide biosynthesis
MGKAEVGQSTELLELGSESNLGVRQDGDLMNPNRTLERMQLLWQQRRLLGRWTGIGVLAFTLIVLLWPPKYESNTRLMPPETQSGSASMMLAALSGKAGGDTLGGYASDLLGIKSSGDLFMGVLRSRTVEDALVRRFDLRKVYWVSRWEDARSDLESRTTISEDRKSGIIDIHVRDRRPERAQAMAKAYVEELDRAMATVATSSARRERQFLETRLAAVKQDLDKAAIDFSQFASQNTAIDIPEQGKAMVEAAARLQGELIAAEAQRQGLEQIYTANNARVRAAQANIDELRRQLNELGGAGTGTQASVAAGSNSPKALYPSIRELPLLGVTYADLYRRTKIQEAVYETLTKQYELAKVQEAKEIPTVKVLDAANYPERRAGVHRILLICMGALFSLAFGCAWILGQATWAETDPQDPRRVFIEQVLAGTRRDVRSLRARWSGLRHRMKSSPNKEKENIDKA